MLVAGAQQYPVILQKYFFGTIAVMHVEVEDGDALNGPAGQSVRGGNGDVVVIAKAHGGSLAGMMTGRAHAAECGGDAALEHEFRCERRGTRGVAGCRQRVRAQPGVWIEMLEAFAGRSRLEHVEVPGLVNALQFLPGRCASFDLDQVVVQMLRMQGIRDARQSLRAFRMAVRYFVAVKYRVMEQRCCHVQSLAGNRSTE